MKNEEITLEVCTNLEALRECCGLRFAGEVEGGVKSANEAADSVSDELFAKLEAAGYQVERPGGQRTTCHGWNGFNLFAHKLGPVGTFDALTAEQIAEIEAIVEAADAHAAEAFA